MMKNKLIILALSLGLSACLGGYSQPSKFYTLSPITETPISQSIRFSLGINRIQMAQYLDRPQILTNHPKTNEVTVSENNRWIESLPNLIARTTAENLSILLPKEQIKVKTFTTEKFDYTLSLEVVKMDTILGDKASLEVWWQIQNTNKKTVLKGKFSKTEPVGKGYEDLAIAQSNLFGQMAEQIAQKLTSLN